MDTRIQIAVLSAVGGFGLGYALGKRRSQTEFDEAVNEACNENREYFYRQRAKLEEERSDAQYEAHAATVRAEEAASALATYQGVESLQEAATEVFEAEQIPEPAVAEYIERDVVTPEEQRAAWQPDPANSPSPMRRPTAPTPHRREPYVDKSKSYIITAEEFLQGEENFAQSTITYYEGDDTLCGEADDIMDDKSRLLLVGPHLSDFAEQDDPNVLYLRNKPMHLDLEVIRNEGKYSDIVAGLGGNE